MGKEEKDVASRMYSKAEKDIRTALKVERGTEIKASTIPNRDKAKLYRSLNGFHKFGAVVNQKSVLPRIFKSKKDKQRYLDYVYKIAVKRCLQSIMKNGLLPENHTGNLFFFVDEHTTATNGRYELREGLEQEFKLGTYNWNYSTFHPPILPSMGSLHLEFCNSASKPLVRAADIVANKILYSVSSRKGLSTTDFGPFITYFP